MLVYISTLAYTTLIAISRIGFPANLGQE